MHSTLRVSSVIVALLVFPAGTLAESETTTTIGPGELLAELIGEAGEIGVPTRSADEYGTAAASYRSILERLGEVDPTELDFDDKVDRELLAAHAETRLFEIEELRLHELVPVRYLSLFATDSLFLRPCGQSDTRVREAVEELEKLPEILVNGRANLTRPARTWTENALYQAWYAELLLREYVPEACVDDGGLFDELQSTAASALEAVREFSAWMRSDLLPRSDRSPAWKPEEIERYQFVHEGLTGWGVAEMLELAEDEEAKTLTEMESLARRIHPSGDLKTVWELMKEEAPPWDELPAMAADYVERADAWLRGPGAHVVEIPEAFDYGVRITSPMGRRILSFGGADYGPTVAGRISGYYVLTPLESRLSDAEKASRIKSYNPYWTHVISYHEWVGHNVQRAWAMAHVERPMRRLYRSLYLSQAWSFYLEKLLEDEGYYETLPHMEALKTRMARLQMRMWRVQRILTKLGMATGEMTFDQAVQAYVDRIGMEPTNALIEVQRDSQSPSPPAREILGELLILELREDYERRMGEHFRLDHFHEALLRWGELPLPVLRKLILEGS